MRWPWAKRAGERTIISESPQTLDDSPQDQPVPPEEDPPPSHVVPPVEPE